MFNKIIFFGLLLTSFTSFAANSISFDLKCTYFLTYDFTLASVGSALNNMPIEQEVKMNSINSKGNEFKGVIHIPFLTSSIDPKTPPTLGLYDVQLFLDQRTSKLIMSALVNGFKIETSGIGTTNLSVSSGSSANFELSCSVK